MNSYPLIIPTPDGPAQLVPGSAAADQPRYALASGELTDIDVRIPDDLAERWFWHASFLVERSADLRALLIDAGTYPPPGVPSPRGSCFDVARRYEATRTTLAADRAARPAPRPARARARMRPAAALQLELEL